MHPGKTKSWRLKSNLFCVCVCDCCCVFKYLHPCAHIKGDRLFLPFTLPSPLESMNFLHSHPSISTSVIASASAVLSISSTTPPPPYRGITLNHIYLLDLSPSPDLPSTPPTPFFESVVYLQSIFSPFHSLSVANAPAISSTSPLISLHTTMLFSFCFPSPSPAPPTLYLSVSLPVFLTSQ